MRTSIFILTVAFLFSATSCLKKTNERFTDTVTSGVISIAVDQSFEPVIQQEINVFESIYTLSGIVPQYVSETEAVNLILKDSVRLAISTRPFTQEEVNSLNERKFFPKSMRIAYDAIAIIVNKNNTDTLISIDQLRAVLLGNTTTWGQLNGGKTTEQIKVVFDNPNSSTVRFAIDSICQGYPLSQNLFAQKSNEEVIDYVSRTPNAMGLIGVSWLGNKSDSTLLSFIDKIRVVSVSRDAEATELNSYKPYQAYIAMNQYPLTRSIYALLNDPRNGLPTGFFSFLTSDRGQRIILKSGMLPATQPLRIVNTRDQL